jgi:hypothetical protein
MTQLIILGVVLAFGVGGVFYIRSRTRKQILGLEDPMTWAKFEEEHGEAELKYGLPCPVCKAVGDEPCDAGLHS